MAIGDDGDRDEILEALPADATETESGEHVPAPCDDPADSGRVARRHGQRLGSHNRPIGFGKERKPL